MKRLVGLLSVCLVLIVSVAAHAIQPIATDDAGTVGKLKLQLEGSVSASWDKAGSTKTDEQIFGATVTAGLLDPLDLVLSVPFKWQQVEDNGVRLLDNGGLNDLTLALKWRCLELGPLAVAVKPAVILPTGDQGRSLGNGRPGYGATLISTLEMKPLAIHANLGFTHQDYVDSVRTTNRSDIWNMSLAGELELVKHLKLLLEVGTAGNSSIGSTAWPSFVTGAVNYAILDNLAVGAGLKGALNNPEKDLTFLAGITFVLP